MVLVWVWVSVSVSVSVVLPRYMRMHCCCVACSSCKRARATQWSRFGLQAWPWPSGCWYQGWWYGKTWMMVYLYSAFIFFVDVIYIFLRIAPSFVKMSLYTIFFIDEEKKTVFPKEKVTRQRLEEIKTDLKNRRGQYYEKDTADGKDIAFSFKKMFPFEKDKFIVVYNNYENMRGGRIHRTRGRRRRTHRTRRRRRRT